MPVINEPHVDLATVYKILKNATDTVDILEYKAGFPEIERPPVAFTVDEAVYAKAVEVCNNPRIKDCLDRIVLRMGGFPVSMTFIAVIGRRYASAGMRDVLIEADILACGSVDQVLNRRHYNRTIYSLKPMFQIIAGMRHQQTCRIWCHQNLPGPPNGLLKIQIIFWSSRNILVRLHRDGAAASLLHTFDKNQKLANAHLVFAGDVALDEFV